MPQQRSAVYLATGTLSRLQRRLKRVAEQATIDPSALP